MRLEICFGSCQARHAVMPNPIIQCGGLVGAINLEGKFELTIK